MQDTQLAVRTNRYVADVPIPEGFERNERESNYTTAADSRRILEVYEGSAPPIKVRNFFLTNMPASGWKFESESLEGSVYSLNFSKGREHCGVKVARKSERGLRPPTEARVLIETR